LLLLLLLNWFCVDVLDPVVEHDYVLVYVHSNVASENKPSFGTLRRIYGIFNRKYKKNLKNLFIMHPGFWVKMTFKLFKPFISSKFWKKLHYIDSPEQLYEHLDRAQVRLPEAVQGAAAIPTVPPLFGVTLAEALQARPQPDVPEDQRLPLVVAHVIEHLAARALLAEGLFRLAGPQQQINSLRRMYDRGEEVDLHLVDDVHVVSGVLKLWLRELPEPVIPFTLYSPFIATQRETDANRWRAGMRSLLLSLPPENRCLLRKLTQFMKLVASNCEHNKMTAANLGICFGPSLMRPLTETMASAIQDIPLVTAMIAHMINFHADLWQ